ncbi:hypothetical protein [Caldimonas sp.]|uniref:hypothetical protein n=1 Tax=Caldimonas sp. TaxID=2838790 RepID=UPI00391B2B19
MSHQEGEVKVRSFWVGDLFYREIPQALPALMGCDGSAAKAWTPRVLPTTVN